MKKRINIISLDVPSPPDYGGVIDIFYRIKALAQSGVGITLHCFTKGRKPSEELERMVDRIYCYDRNMSLLNQLSATPFIVRSRSHPALIDNLLTNDYPILFEGIHSSSLLADPRLANRNKILRMHNREDEYYTMLARQERSLTRKCYMHIEAIRLKHYQRIIARADQVLAISLKEMDWLNRHFPDVTVHYVPCYHANRNVASLPDTVCESSADASPFILYHGNLAVSENAEAAMHLVRYVFPRLNYRCVVAGRSPSPLLIEQARKHPNINIVANPTPEEMASLIAQAHVNVLITFQATGMKLKLVNALYNGRFVAVNSEMVEGTPLAPLCSVAPDDDTLASTIDTLMRQPFTPADIACRQDRLVHEFDYDAYTRLIIDML